MLNEFNVSLANAMVQATHNDEEAKKCDKESYALVVATMVADAKDEMTAIACIEDMEEKEYRAKAFMQKYFGMDIFKEE